MLKIYDTSGILSIISANEFESLTTDPTPLKCVNSAISVINEKAEIEPFDLRQCLPLLKFSEDPYDLLSDAYWKIVFQD